MSSNGKGDGDGLGESIEEIFSVAEGPPVKLAFHKKYPPSIKIKTITKLKTTRTR
jgi:hypothetical protein